MLPSSKIELLTLEQLKKDLILSGFDSVLNTEICLEDNLNKMISFFDDNKSNDLNKMYHFLYRLDLSETEFKNLLEFDIEQLVYLVFNRAKKKVVFKTNFN